MADESMTADELEAEIEKLAQELDEVKVIVLQFSDTLTAASAWLRGVVKRPLLMRILSRLGE